MKVRRTPEREAWSNLVEDSTYFVPNLCTAYSNTIVINVDIDLCHLFCTMT